MLCLMPTFAPEMRPVRGRIRFMADSGPSRIAVETKQAVQFSELVLIVRKQGWAAAGLWLIFASICCMAGWGLRRRRLLS